MDQIWQLYSNYILNILSSRVNFHRNAKPMSFIYKVKLACMIVFDFFCFRWIRRERGSLEAVTNIQIFFTIKYKALTSMLQICSSKLFNSKSAKISKTFYSKLHSMCLIHLVITWAKFLTVHSNISICVIVCQAGQRLLRLETRALHRIEILQTSQLQKRVQNKGLVKNTLHICPW